MTRILNVEPASLRGHSFARWGNYPGHIHVCGGGTLTATPTCFQKALGTFLHFLDVLLFGVFSLLSLFTSLCLRTNGWRDVYSVVFCLWNACCCGPSFVCFYPSLSNVLINSVCHLIPWMWRTPPSSRGRGQATAIPQAFLQAACALIMACECQH